MDNIQLITSHIKLSTKQNETRKDILLSSLQEWKTFNKGNRVVNYYWQLKEILYILNYDLSKVNKELINELWKKKGWSERHKWPLTAWNSFCKFGRNKHPELFPTSCIITKPRLYKNIVLPDKLRQEIQDIIDSHIVSSTGTKLKTSSQKKILTSFFVFRNFVLSYDSSREINSLEDFTENDVLQFKDELIKTGMSPLSGQKVSYNTLVSFLIDLRRIYKLGVAQKKLKKDIFKEITIDKQKTPKREFCLSKEQIEQLRSIGLDKIEQMTLEEKFEQLRNNAMIAVQYEAALRAQEVVRLCWEDIPEYERTKTNIGPIIIRGSKLRPQNHQDRVYILFDRLDVELRRWREVSEEYCRKNNIGPPIIEENGKKYRPIFFSKRGTPLSVSTYISSIFTQQLRKAGIVLPQGYKTHIIRHSRITHWVDDGYPFEKVHENARHCDLEETWRYFHSNAKKRIEVIEKIEGLNHKELKTSLLPPKGILRIIIDTVVEYLKKSTIHSQQLSYYEIEKMVYEKCSDCSGLFYTFREVVDKFGISRTQTYERLKWLEKIGLLHPIVQNNKKRYLKEEIDYITKLVNSRKASIAFGYKEKVPTTIPGLVSKGIIKSVKIGKLHYFDPTELVQYFSEKCR